MKEHARNNRPVVLVGKPMDFTFHFGMAYLAGYLKQQGEDVRIIFKPGKSADFYEFAANLIAMNPLLVGFGSLYGDLYFVRDFIKLLNKLGRNFPVVIGGQMVSPTPKFAIEVTGADFGVIGEGEIILYNLVRTLRNNSDPLSVKGLIVRDEDSIQFTGDGDYIEDLSKLPPVPYDLFPANMWLHAGRYYTDQEQPHWRYNDRVLCVHGGRGCPYRCNFCYHHDRPRYRSINDIMAETGPLIELFRANMLYFVDDLVIATPDRAAELAESIPKLPRKVEYYVSCRFDILSRINDDLLKHMKHTGCRVMGLGIESGSQRILDLMHKKITIAQIQEGLGRLQSAGIMAEVSMMVGQWSETKDEAQASVDLLAQTIRANKNLTYTALTITTPFPGSELYAMALEKGLLKSHHDFFNRFNPSGHVYNLAVNLSAMSDDELIGMHKLLCKTYKEEKEKALGKPAVRVEYLRKVLVWRNQRLREHYFQENRKTILALVFVVYDLCYNAVQIILDWVRLKLRGI